MTAVTVVEDGYLTDYQNRALLIEPLEVLDGVQTDYGVKRAVRADVVVLDGDDAPMELPGVQVTQAHLVESMRKDVGGRVVAVLVQDQGKDGQPGAWKLDADAVTQDQVQAAVAYVKAKEAGTLVRTDYDGPDREQYAADGRQRLDVGNFATVAEQLRRTLGADELAGVFRRSGELVHTPRIGEDGYLLDETVDLGPAQVRPITAGQLATMVDVKFACGAWVPVKRGSKKKKWQPRLVPQQAVTRVHDAGRIGEDTPNLRELRGVTHTPALRPDGSVIDRPGYDPSTGYLYLPDRDLDVIKVPDDVRQADVAAARDLLLVLTDEFPWVTDDDRANWYGLAFTPPMRAMVPPPYPMGICTATNPGSGKGFLVRMIKDLHGGTMRGELPRDQEELRKSITATLVDTTAPVAIFDNLTGVVRSSILDALLTNPEHTDRYLGQSRSVTVPNDRLWLATGNNAAIGGDLARRVLFVEIDPGMPNPHLRTGFKIHPPTWVPANRGALLAAMLTIIRGWVNAGRPGLAESTDRSDDFRLWYGTMRAMLSWAGFPGTFGGSSGKVAIAADPDTDEWAAFLEAVHGVYGGETFTAKDLVQALENGQYHGTAGHTCQALELDPVCLPGDLADKFSRAGYGKRAGFSKSLGRWLLNRAGRYANGWKVEKVGQGRVVEWRVIGP
jgi:hypothetical protein